MKLNRIILVLAALTSLIIAGCGGKDKDRIRSEREMYDRAYSSLNSGAYETAIERYTALSAAYPFGTYTTQGELEICYAHYKLKNSDEAVPCVDEFLSLHPTHPHIDYAYYLKGLAHLPLRAPRLGERFFKTQEQFSDHDAESAREAYEAFNVVIERFPFSEYAESSRTILVNLINAFARHDLRIARFYLYRNAYVGAINRVKQVLLRYETSPHTEEALAILIYAYEQLELPELAADNRRVLSYNFPGSKYLGNEHIVLDQEILERSTKPLLLGVFR
ncbi:MAG: outer membrane protein assembly factor BamD [Acidiferrobacterales bacterium]|nr:outer membrane protein assembly factor BamD [Acidiferrobacterales bacterium]